MKVFTESDWRPPRVKTIGFDTEELRHHVFKMHPRNKKTMQWNYNVHPLDWMTTYAITMDKFHHVVVHKHRQHLPYKVPSEAI